MQDSRWGDPQVVGSFASARANPALVEFVRSESRRQPSLRVLDVGCGAARNIVAIAGLATEIVGVDLERSMLDAARERLARREAALPDGRERAGAVRVALVQAAMHRLPLRARTVDLVVAHGIWNLARSGAEFRAALAEAGRVARSGAALFVFTFSRTTLAADARPVPGEGFVFTQFSGEPQCFLAETQLVQELSEAGFEKDAREPLRELNRPRAGRELLASPGPVVYEGVFRRR